MLQVLELENFKAFGERVRIPCAPITLIFGQNSAGKSSILQSLLMLKQTIKSGVDRSKPCLVPQGSFVNLGSFSDLLYNHDPKRNLSISLQFATTEQPIGIKITFKETTGKEDKREIVIGQIDLLQGNTCEPVAKFTRGGSYDLNETGRCFDKKYQRVDLVERLQDHQDSFVKDSDEALRGNYDGVDSYKYADFRGCSNFKWDWIKNDNQWKEYFVNLSITEKLRWLPLLTILDPFIETPACRNNSDAVLRYLKVANFKLSSAEDYVTEFEKAGLMEARDRFLSMVGNDPNPEALDLSLKNFLKEWVLFFDGILPVGGQHYEELFGVNPIAIAKILSDKLGENLLAIRPIGPYREAPKREYENRENIPEKYVGLNGGYFPDLLFQDNENLVRDKTTRWLKDLGVDYSVLVDRWAERSIFEKNTGDGDILSHVKNRFNLHLVEKDKVKLGLNDVGFGVSQILPIIVQCVISEGDIITIEQPELHIHPKLQADLGDLFVEAIKRKNQIIIETHSEHLILRLLRRIRETTEGTIENDNLKLAPQDVQVIYVKGGPNGSTVTPIPITPDGDFEIKWPDGFFAERAQRSYFNMLHEFAVDPGVLSSWEQVRYIIEKFGVETGRMISRFPKNWKRLVYEAYTGCSERDRKRIEQKLTEIDDKLFRSGRDSNPVFTWLENAERQQEIKPFHAIISDKNPKGNNGILLADDLSEDLERFKIARQANIPRDPRNLAKCVSKLFENSKEILFIDQYFNPSAPRYKETFREFIFEATRYGQKFQRIEYHLKYDQYLSKQDFEKGCFPFQKILPQGIKISFIRWVERPNGKRLHPRYILTDIGGVQFDFGLDSGRSHNRNETTQVTLLEKPIYQEIWNDFQNQIRKRYHRLRLLN